MRARYLLRQPLRVADQHILSAPVAVVYELFFAGTSVKRLLQSIESEITSQRLRYSPSNDLTREDIRQERDADEARPDRDVCDVGHPKLVGSIGREVTLHKIRWALFRIIDDLRLLVLAAANNAVEAHLTHQAVHGAASHNEAFSVQLQPDLACSVGRPVLLPNPLDLFTEPRITNQSRRQPSWVGLSGFLFVVYRRTIGRTLQIGSTRTHLEDRRWTPPSLLRPAAELRLCETRGRLANNLVGSAKFSIFAFEILHPSLLLARSRTACKNLFLRAVAPSSRGMEPPAIAGRFSIIRE